MADTLFRLNSAAEIPALGLGTWQSPAGEVKRAVLHALKSGYRHIDCAYVYGNEDEVGEALKEAFASGVKREDVFVTTKLWCTYHSRVQENLDMSLKSLGLASVDLYLMHWPCPMSPNGNDPMFPKLPDGSRDLDKSWSHIKTWQEMENILPSGKAKAIGLANYSVKYLEELLPHATITPAVNQIENHPYLPQNEIVDFCQSRGIHITAYSPLGSSGSPLFQDETVQTVARKHNATVGSVLLSFHVARGCSVLAKSVTPARIEENMKMLQLEPADMEALLSISKIKGFKRYIYPAFGVDFGFPDKQ